MLLVNTEIKYLYRMKKKKKKRKKKKLIVKDLPSFPLLTNENSDRG